LKVFLLISFLVFFVFFQAGAEPEIKDNDFFVQKFVTGIASSPTTMTLEGNDILVLQKDDGSTIH